MSQSRKVSFRLWESMVPFAVSVLLLVLSTMLKGDDAGHGFYQLSLLCGALVAAFMGYRKGISLRVIKDSIVANVKPILPTIFFLVCVGAISATWLFGGVIPSGIYFGMKYLNPKLFLPGVALFSGMMGMACGSSWLTIATMGLVFLKIGGILGFSSPWVAGAVISGAYFGDKLTPLSETTVLASTMTNTSLTRHVRYMLWTSLPAFGLALLGFFVLGFFANVESSSSLLKDGTLQSLENKFHIGGFLLFVPLAVVGLTMFGLSPLLILALGALLGGVIAVFYQDFLLEDLIPEGEVGTLQRLIFVAKKTFSGIDISLESAGKGLNTLSSKGIWGMWPTITIILSSVVLSGAMEGTNLLEGLISGMGEIKSRKKLVGLTLLTAFFFNLTVADQYLAIVLTSKLFSPIFLRMGLASENVSRSVEDSATVTSPLIPWNTCGMAQAGVLGVPTLHYLPFCFFNLLSPAMNFLVSAANIKIAKVALPVEEIDVKGKKRISML